MALTRLVVAGLLLATMAVPARARAVSDPMTWTAPLSTEGRYIVDAKGERFKLKSGNWHGASGTWTGSGDAEDPANHHAGEKSDRIPLGLDRAPMTEMIESFRGIGLNSIRLPFSNEMVHDTRPVSDAAVRANPGLRGKTPLQVYDAVVAALTSAGFAVILNNHTNTTRWCCGVDGNERWNTSQTTRKWEEDWLLMVKRYRNNARVVGADLYNEVRRNILDDPNWGWGNDHDWHAAAQRVADRILTEANPDILIVVEGINWYGIPADGFPHGRPTLEPARTLSHTLLRSRKLVYSAHFYGYTGPNHSGATGVGETSDPRYRDFGREELSAVLDRQAFFVAQQGGQHFTAPVWISEFGSGGREETDPKSRAWFENFVDHLVRNDTDFAYWPLVGWHQNRRGNGWAMLHWDAAGNRMSVDDGDDWRAPAWHRLVGMQGKTGPVPRSDAWNMLAPDHGDAVRSPRLLAEPDWDPGARKAACPDGQRLIGLAQTGGRGLCTEAGMDAKPLAHQAIRDERHVVADWASGYTKFQCPPGHVVTGYALRGADVSSVLCKSVSRQLGTNGRTVWFDRGDNRPAGARGGDFAHGRFKGQCAEAEYIGGIAWTGRVVGRAKTPDAVYCVGIDPPQ